MQYLIHLIDAAKQHTVNLALEEADVSKPAIDVVFDVIGASDPNVLVAAGTVSSRQLDALQALQREIFDHDAQGSFIREGIEFSANGRPLDPDRPMKDAFELVTREGTSYQRCELVVQTTESQALESRDRLIKTFAPMIFLHEIAVGNSLDVTKDYAELTDLLKEAELRQWTDIDVGRAVYKLAPAGQQLHDGWMQEAQELIRLYDIYGDVDVDASGNARFDTGFGKDLRVPVFEHEGVDPFRARLLLGLNDGEWDRLPNWRELIYDPAWYEEVFAPVESAPSRDELGEARLARIIDQGKAALREDSYS